MWFISTVLHLFAWNLNDKTVFKQRVIRGVCVVLTLVIRCEAHVAKCLICNTLFSQQSVWACLKLTRRPYIWQACLKTECEGHQASMIIGTPEDLCCFLIQDYSREKQTEAPANMGEGGCWKGGGVSVFLLRKQSNHLSSNNQQVCFPTNSSQFSSSPSVNTELSDSKTKVWTTFSNSRLGTFLYSERLLEKNNLISRLLLELLQAPSGGLRSWPGL